MCSTACNPKSTVLSSVAPRPGHRAAKQRPFRVHGGAEGVGGSASLTVLSEEAGLLSLWFMVAAGLMVVPTSFVVGMSGETRWRSLWKFCCAGHPLQDHAKHRPSTQVKLQHEASPKAEEETTPTSRHVHASSTAP